MNNKHVFASNLQKQMDLHRKSRKDVCKELDISYNTFSDWVTGKKYPRMGKIELLANYFGVLKSDLIEEKKDSAEENGQQSTDIAEEMGRILNELNNTQRSMTVDGSPLDKDTRDLLISSLENSLKVAKMMKNRNE